MRLVFGGYSQFDRNAWYVCVCVCVYVCVCVCVCVCLCAVIMDMKHVVRLNSARLANRCTSSDLHWKKSISTVFEV